MESRDQGCAVNFLRRFFYPILRAITKPASGPEGEPGPIAAQLLAGEALVHIRAGNELLGANRLAEALDRYQTAIDTDPTNSAAHVNLAFVLLEMGMPDRAISSLRRALALTPNSADAHYMLGSALAERRAFMDAIFHLQKAIEHNPDLSVAYRDLGKTLFDAGDHDRAMGVLRAGIERAPGFADLHYFLGNIELHQMRLDAALASFDRALQIEPTYAAVLNNKSQALQELCDFTGAAQAARAAIAINPFMHVARSNLLMTLSSDPGCTTEEYLRQAQQFGETLLIEAKASVASHRTGRRAAQEAVAGLFRVGFVSGDFVEHPVGFFLESVMAHWGLRHGMATYAYSNRPGQDSLTARLKARFDVWRDIFHMDDSTAAQLIESDRIDVLIDLSGHTALNRLPLFASRPAPVQVSWLGYWASTGLPAMDWVLADRVSVPLDHETDFMERIWYLPDTRLCFSPPADPQVPAPSLSLDRR